MKSSLIPIACGTALALMTGAAATHWCSVRDMVALAKQLPSGPRFERAISTPATAPVTDESILHKAEHLLAEGRMPEKAPQARAKDPGLYSGDARKAPERTSERKRTDSPSDSQTDVRIERLLTALEGTMEQNQELRDRLADTNRDVMELRFQVDSYHGQFRPLKVEEEPTYFDDASGGVLPPLEAP